MHYIAYLKDITLTVHTAKNEVFEAELEEPDLELGMDPCELAIIYDLVSQEDDCVPESATFWDDIILAVESCADCPYSIKEMDPYGTGDSPTMYECTHPVGSCPWDID